jgi:restriction system protein
MAELRDESHLLISKFIIYMADKKLNDWAKKNIPDWDENKNVEKQSTLSDFLKKNISDWSIDKETKKYTFTAPRWFTDVRNVTAGWRIHNSGAFKYDGFWHINHEADVPHYLLPIKTFDLNYEIYRNLKPCSISDYEDVTKVDKYGLEEIIEVSLVDLKYIFLNHSESSHYDDEEGWDTYYLSSWKDYKKTAEEFHNSYDDMVAAQKATFDEAWEIYNNANTSVLKKAEFILLRNPLPDFFSNYRPVQFDNESKILQLELKFPDYRDEEIVIGQTARYKKKYATQTAKRKIVKQTLYSLIIWHGHLLALHLKDFDLNQIAINVNQTWFDPATGKPVSGIIASVLGDAEYFRSLNIKKVDPVACIRQLKGITTPSLENQSPIRPIFDLNKDDKRLVDTKDIDGALEEGENLAAMDWEDFEHLVSQLFEWEFAKDGAEVKVTQASRDRGVDAILFDPDPIRGGKYVLQAKRYTRVVDVASVRDLYGTVMNEGANRGILITTSSYGSDSYEFAKNKPISLIDGANLTQLLKKPGKNYKIDLKEARDILGLN